MTVTDIPYLGPTDNVRLVSLRVSSEHGILHVAVMPEQEANGFITALSDQSIGRDDRYVVSVRDYHPHYAEETR